MFLQHLQLPIRFPKQLYIDSGYARNGADLLTVKFYYGLPIAFRTCITEARCSFEHYSFLGINPNS